MQKPTASTATSTSLSFRSATSALLDNSSTPVASRTSTHPQQHKPPGAPSTVSTTDAITSTISTTTTTRLPVKTSSPYIHNNYMMQNPRIQQIARNLITTTPSSSHSNSMVYLSEKEKAVLRAQAYPIIPSDDEEDQVEEEEVEEEEEEEEDDYENEDDEMVNKELSAADEDSILMMNLQEYDNNLMVKRASGCKRTGGQVEKLIEKHQTLINENQAKAACATSGGAVKRAGLLQRRSSILEEITVNGQRGLWLNKDEELNWRGEVPISAYRINQDSQPEIITKRTNQRIGNF
jgi:hypothetical protein